MIERGVELFNAGRFWEAHEAWEEGWLPDRHGPDRGFYKGLIQIAAGCLHYRRRNRRGAVNKWTSGRRYLLPYLPLHNGLDLEPLVVDTSRLLAAMTEPGWRDALVMPQIRRRSG